MDVREQVGRNLRRLRYKAGLSQEELAFRAELNRGYVNGIERYVRNPTIVVLQKLARTLNVDAAELLAKPETIRAEEASGIKGKI